MSDSPELERATESRMFALVQAASDGVALARPDGTIIDATPALTRMFGFTPEEWIAQPGAYFVHPEDAPSVGARFAELVGRPGETYTIENRVRHKDGSWRWIESKLKNLLDDPNVGAIAINFRDVTERRRMEEELREARLRLSTILSTTSSVAYIFAANEPYGSTFMGENVKAVFGYDAADLVREPTFWISKIHPEDRPRVFADLEQLAVKERCVHEYRLMHADSTYRWVRGDLALVRDGQDRPKEIIGCWIDITPRRTAEDALRRSELNFRALIEHLPTAVSVHKDLVIVYANPTLLALLGCDRLEDVVGTSTMSFLPSDRHDGVASRLAELERTSRTTPHEVELLRRDGRRVPVEVESVNLTFDGQPCTVSFMRDLTERREMQARIRMADRLVSVGTLAAGVAHEINNPLTYVLTNLGVLADELPALCEQRPSRLTVSAAQALLRDALEGASRVRSAVRDLRSLTRADDESTGPVDLRSVLESCARMAENEIRHRARLVTAIEDVQVQGNSSRLGQVFLNLLINAAQAIRDGHADENEIRVEARHEGPSLVVVEVSDTGCGISDEHQARIFDPFFTTKALGVGTGLGLAICHGIVEAHGGEITVASKLDQGSTFRVTLPAARASASRVPERVEKIVAVSRPRVLVVDDEPKLGSALQMILEDTYDVLYVKKAVEALTRITSGERFDAILCDVMMPEMNGMDFHASVLRHAPELAACVVFITGGAFADGQQQFLRDVGNPFLEKPFDMDVLRSTLASVMTRRSDGVDGTPQDGHGGVDATSRSGHDGHHDGDRSHHVASRARVRGVQGDFGGNDDVA